MLVYNYTSILQEVKRGLAKLYFFYAVFTGKMVMIAIIDIYDRI